MRIEIHDMAEEVLAIARNNDAKKLIAGFLAFKLLFSDLKMNDTEIIISAGYTPIVSAIRECQKTVNKELNARYGTAHSDNDNSNAFKHAYWNALMAKNVNPNFAKKFADAHEYGDPGNFTNQPASAKMDFYNNHVGRYLGELNSDKSDSQLANIVQGKLEAG